MLYNDNIEVLKFLLESKDDQDLFEEVHLYESHMGGLYLTSIYYNDHECYCETCGDSDWHIDSGSFIDLLTEYIRLFIKDYENNLLSIGWALLDNVDYDGLIALITNSERVESDDECASGCPTISGLSLEDMLKDIKIPYACRKCKLESVLVDMLY